MNLAAQQEDTTTGATRRLAGFAAALTFANLDAAARHAAKRHILDSLGACLAGSAQTVTEAAEAVLARGSGQRDAIRLSRHARHAAAHGLALPGRERG